MKQRRMLLVLLLLSLVLGTGLLAACGGGNGNGTVQPSTALPAAPTGITATAGDGQVTISWNAVSGATSYNLYMASQSGVNRQNFSTLADAMKHEGVTSPYTHTGLANGKTYYFVVTAVNAAGESTESSEVSATPTMGGGTGASIGPAGGSITALDGRLSLQIPSGALDSDTFVSIEAITNTAPQGVGVAYRLLPDGLTLNKPAALTLHYSDADNAGSNAQMLGIAFKDEQGMWQGLTAGSLDTASKTLSVQITHFSEWAPYEAYRIEPRRSDLLTGGSMTYKVFTVGPPIGHGTLGGVTIPLFPLPQPVRPSEWAINGIVGGNTEVGEVLFGLGGEGLYTAPSKMPNANPVAVSAGSP